MNTNKKQVINAPYHFTPTEKSKIAGDLADRQLDLVSAEQKKSSVVATWNDKLKRIKLDIQAMSRHYSDGYMTKTYECFVIKDFAKKEIIYKDVESGAIVDRKPFGPADHQRDLEDPIPAKPVKQYKLRK